MENIMTHPVYIHLLHGCDDPNQEMDGWGFTGPVLGPFEAVHFTYLTHIHCIPLVPNGDELGLRFQDGMLVHDGKFYSDFEICGGHNP
jgi:hypothetical protein